MSNVSAVHCDAEAAIRFANFCVANPTISPSGIPGRMMSQKRPMPALRITNRLKRAATTIPTNNPYGIDRTRCEKTIAGP